MTRGRDPSQWMPLHERVGTIGFKKKARAERPGLPEFYLVAGAGFEPATFGL